MSSPVPAQQSQVVTSQDHAVWGAKMRAAGLDEAQIVQFLAMIENEATLAAQAAGRRVAMTISDMFVGMLRNVHDQTAQRVYDRLARRNSGRMSTMLHQDCLNVAAEELYGVSQPAIIQHYQQ